MFEFMFLLKEKNSVTLIKNKSPNFLNARISNKIFLNVFLVIFSFLGLIYDSFAQIADSNSGSATSYNYHGKNNVIHGNDSSVYGINNLVGWSAIIERLPDLDDLTDINAGAILVNKDNIGSFFHKTKWTGMMAVGNNNVSIGDKSIAFGFGNISSGRASVAVGKSNFASAWASQAFGDFNTSHSFKAAAFGYKNYIGKNARFGVAFGSYNQVTNAQSYAFGGYNYISSMLSSSFGFGNTIQENSRLSSALGFQNVINGVGSNVFGLQNIVKGQYNLALGSGNKIKGENTIVIGTAKLNPFDIVFNDNQYAPNKINLSLNVINRVTGDNNISIGNNNILNAQDTVILGNKVIANNTDNSIVLGNLSFGSQWGEPLENSKISFGELSDVLNLNPHFFARSSPSNGTVSIGAMGRERRIKNVAAGVVSEISSDAINGSQLYVAIKAIGEVPIIFSGDAGFPVNKRLGGELVIRGGAKPGRLTSGNIGVVATKSGLELKLSKDLFNLRRLKFERGIEINSSTNIISGVEDPKHNKDVVNLRYLKQRLAQYPQSLELMGNDGGLSFLPVGKRLIIAGLKRNKNSYEFDEGKNVFTSINTTKEGFEYTIALKKSPEFENLTLTGSKDKSSGGSLSILDLSGNEKISSFVDVNNNGIITVTGNNEETYTDVMHDGIEINDSKGSSKIGTKVFGTGGVNSKQIKKRRLVHKIDDMKTEEIATLNDGFIFKGNEGELPTKLNSKVLIAGADTNTNWSDFDAGHNIMTKVETVNGETVIRIALRKDLKLKNGVFGGSGADGELKLKDKDGKDGLTLNSDKILFNNIDKLDENGQPQKMDQLA